MSGGGSNTPTWSDASDINTASSNGQISAFLNSQAGQQYASLYNSSANYYYDGNSSFHAVANGDEWDVSSFINAYKTWETGANLQQTNWQNYANAVNANEGGEGDNTITTGASQSQRNQLLGSLANGGNTPTPTSGLGTLGASNIPSTAVNAVDPNGLLTTVVGTNGLSKQLMGITR